MALFPISRNRHRVWLFACLERLRQPGIRKCCSALPVPAFLEFAPAAFLQLDIKLARRGTDTLPCLVAFLVGHAFHLVEPGDGIAYMAGILQRLLALFRKG